MIKILKSIIRNCRLEYRRYRNNNLLYKHLSYKDRLNKLFDFNKREK